MNATAKQVTIRLPADLISYLEEDARRDARTLSALVRKVLLEYKQASQATKRRKAT